MFKFYILLLFLWFSALTLQAQTTSGPVPDALKYDFEGIQSFLSSDWMEGREAGSRGGFMAADFVSSLMQLDGLAPFGDQKHTYFQNFDLVRYQAEKVRFAVISKTPFSESALQLISGIDFELTPGPYGSDAEAPLVFAGYGISMAGKGYDDYKGLDINGRIVVVLDGFPGHTDTTSHAWQKLGKSPRETLNSDDNKLRNAEKHGAVALIVISAGGRQQSFTQTPGNQDVVQATMNSTEVAEAEYEDPYHALPGDTSVSRVPLFRLGPHATRMLFDGTGIVLSEIEKKIAQDFAPASTPLKDKIIRFSIAVKSEQMRIRNVLGIIYGKDTTKSIVVGAHYDHLGMRGKDIYNGADDNASGVTGILALAKAWKEYGEKPACNLLFSAWTAEEKGLLGSSYFVAHTKADPVKILLYINLDMISRSAPEDTANRQVSIGTMTGSDSLRDLARKLNLRLSTPFELDLWDVTGHSGSDYASFTAQKIPVMTFFSGFHADYHTPGDVMAKTDPGKMKNILKIVSDCIREYAVGPSEK